MRSKEEKEAIKSLENFVNQKYYNGVSAAEMKTVLNYIEELEKDVKDAMDGYQDLGKEVYFNFISKDKIKDKIKELENMRDTSITSEAFNIFNGEIIVLKEILEK